MYQVYKKESSVEVSVKIESKNKPFGTLNDKEKIGRAHV